MNVDQLFHTGRPGVLTRRCDRPRVDVRRDDLCRRLLLRLVRRGADLPPGGRIKPFDMDESVVAPEESRRPAFGEERRLDRERPASAHRIDEAGPAFPARRENHRRREGFLHRRRKRDLPVTASGEGLAGGVQVDEDIVSPPVDMNHRPVAVGPESGRRPQRSTTGRRWRPSSLR